MCEDTGNIWTIKYFYSLVFLPLFLSLLHKLRANETISHVISYKPHVPFAPMLCPASVQKYLTFIKYL